MDLNAAFGSPAGRALSAEAIRYLDALMQRPEVLAYKQRTYELALRDGFTSVLDIGCGAGSDVCALATLAPDVRVIGLDPNPEFIEEARRRARALGVEATFIVGDGRDLPFESGSLGSLRADRVLQHVSDPRDVLAEMVRVAQPGGVIVVGDPDWATLSVAGLDAELAVQLDLAVHAAFANPRAGSRNAGILRQLDACDVEEERVGVEIAGRADADEMLAFSDIVVGASGRDGERLRAALDEREREAGLQVTMSGYLVSARTRR